MKTVRNFASLGFMAFLLFGLSTLANAQTATVSVTNTTSAAMQVTIVGSTYSPNLACNPDAHANGTVSAGATATFSFVSNSTGLPVSAVCFGVQAIASGVPGATLAWVDDCRNTSQTGASTATGTYDCSATQGSSSQTATVY